MKSSSEHWDKIFRTTDQAKLGWYEEDASQTFELLSLIPSFDGLSVLLPGVGTSLLIDELLLAGAKLVLNDISQEALGLVSGRVDDDAPIQWLCQDIAEPIQGEVPLVDLWIDRAVLHFLTDEDDVVGYFKNVKSTVKIGGHALFAEFAPDGAPKCAGLTLRRYSIDDLASSLGDSFELVSQRDYIYTNPNGDPRPYVYGLFKRVS